MIQAVTKIVRKTTYYLCVISAITMFFIMLLTVADVAGRYFFNSPIQGTFEISRFFLIIMVLLAIAYAQQLDQHIAVDFFILKFPEKTRFFITTLSTVMGLVFFAVVAWQGWEGGLQALHNKSSSDILRIPAYPFEFLVAVGSFFLCIELLLKLATLISHPMTEKGKSA